MKNPGMVVLIAIILIAIGACGSRQKNHQGAPEEKRKVDQKSLQMAPERISVGDMHLKLKVYLWRDFQPITPPGGRPLKARVSLEEESGKEISGKFKLLKLYVLRDGEVWESTPSPQVGVQEESHRVTGIAQNGPLWDTDKPVDVILQFEGPEGKVFYLKAPQQHIVKTY